MHIWLRSETKLGERRTPLTPGAVRILIENDFQVTVESSENRIFSDDDYKKAGCELVPSGSWKNAPKDAWILGLKELPLDRFPLTHKHIYFAHAYKDQKGWLELLKRFENGKGVLYDLEYLTDDAGRRVAAFGYWAGFAGAAVALMVWQYQKTNPKLVFPKLTPFENVESFIKTVSFKGPAEKYRDPRGDPEVVLFSPLGEKTPDRSRTTMGDIFQQTLKEKPDLMIMGALGRCGRGAQDMAKNFGLKTILWDQQETKGGGPFEEILKHGIFVNCVLVQTKMPAFLTKEMLSQTQKLSVICDVSCDPFSPFNPLPIYKDITTFEKPTTRLFEGENPLDLIAIDHLPSLLPKESSEDFCEQLLPHLLQLGNSPVWQRAEKIFEEKLNYT